LKVVLRHAAAYLGLIYVLPGRELELTDIGLSVSLKGGLAVTLINHESAINGVINLPKISFGGAISVSSIWCLIVQAKSTLDHVVLLIRIK
jgi:hypothetical protein